MKTILQFIIFLFVGFASSNAQTLFGTTTMGAETGRGTIIKLDISANHITVPFSFKGSPNGPLYTNFMQATDGMLYAMTSKGGETDNGTIFSFNPSDSSERKLWDFDSAGGKNPFGSLVQASDGKLYGMTNTGGSSNVGVIFSFNPSSSTYTKLFDFNNANGALPTGSLYQAPDGKLYGMTSMGGNGNYGVIFSFDPSASVYTKLHDFDKTNGAVPYGSLMQAANGELYGMTSTGGAKDTGVIFMYDLPTSTFTKLFDFDGINGGKPYGTLVQGPDGNMYGLTYRGGIALIGVIFSFDPSTSTYTKLEDFIGSDERSSTGVNGGEPTGSLIQARNGRLYGVTPEYGYNNDGVFFSYDPSTSIFRTVKDFSVDGTTPHGSVFEGKDHRLYGMTSKGGVNDAGIIFSVDPSTGYSKLKDLGVNENGGNFTASPILASDGKLYGMTPFGGKYDGGVIYSFDPSNSVYKKLKDFNFESGSRPYGSLVQGDNGKIYGINSNGGGSLADGVIFSFDPSSAKYTKLKVLHNDDGIVPLGSLIQASNGKLYGLTLQGGAGFGTMFSFDPSTLVFTRLHNFDALHGSPMGSLVQASDGKLYGLALGSGSNGDAGGCIFSFNPATSAFAILKELDPANDGALPFGSLIQANDGKLYGMAYNGGRSNESTGTIFSFDPSTSTLVKLKDFQGLDGANPAGSLFQASDGKLYGMTRYGGSYNLGVTFSYDPSTATYTKLLDFDGVNGGNPYGSGFVEIECTTGTAFYRDADGDGYGNPYNWKIAKQKPEGYVTNNRDCDDKDKTKHPVTYYADADGDNLGDANVSTVICGGVAPAGYVKNNNDDDDHSKMQYKLSNYPNPFTASSTIKYSLPFDSKVSIKVYDAFGKVVYTLVNEPKKAGTHTVNFNASGLSSGPIFYKITAISKDQNYEQTNQMIKAR